MTELIVVFVITALLLLFGFWLLVKAGNPLDAPVAPTPTGPVPVEPPAQMTTTAAQPQVIPSAPRIVHRHFWSVRPTREEPPPPPEPVVVVPGPKPPPVRTVTLKLVSAKGRPLGTTTLDVRGRRPVLRHRTRDGQMSVFVADSIGTDGAWTYRRVGVERER